MQRYSYTPFSLLSVSLYLCRIVLSYGRIYVSAFKKELKLFFFVRDNVYTDSVQRSSDSSYHILHYKSRLNHITLRLLLRYVQLPFWCTRSSMAVQRCTVARSLMLPTFQVVAEFALPAATASFNLWFIAPLLAAEHFRFTFRTRLETFLFTESYPDIWLICHFVSAQCL